MAGNRLVCGYHGWSYDRQGKLLAVTESRDWQDITRRCIGLDEIRCEVFGGWIFVNESGSSESLEEFLQPITRFLTHLPLSELRLMHRSVVEVECNVKLLIDNFLEVYHFKLLHPRTTDKIFDSTGSNMHLWRNGHSMMLSPNRSRQWVDPGTRGMLEMVGSTDIEKYYNPSYCLFPNLIIPIAPTGMPFVSMWPKTVRSSTLEVLWFAPDPGTENRDPLWDTRIANFDRIVEEDIQFAEPMQKSIESPGFHSVPLSYQERRIYHWNVEVDRRIGEENIDPALRIAPTLGAFIE
jgi:phenylpropionate dioxygenase-like ring-hydroxylating dioxygenase large terminal subunit